VSDNEEECVASAKRRRTRFSDRPQDVSGSLYRSKQMGNANAIEIIENDTHFSRSALKELNDKFLKKYPNGKMTRDEFLNGN
jgi:hypothetical protein